MPEGVKRKISAILSADVAGYSKMMEADEETTVRTIESYRKTVVSLIEQHDGKVIDSPGDNILSEFSSVVDAVQCAVEIQHVIKAKNAVLPESRRMEFRIGINLGDVIEEEGRTYGDGINIAARLEGLAEAGGICISDSAYQQIESKLALGYEDIGEQALKNISKPVRAYRIPLGSVDSKAAIAEKAPKRSRWVTIAVAAAFIAGIGAVTLWYQYRQGTQTPATAQKAKEIATEKPSIAVLPFRNISGDPEQEYFSDGLTEEIINALTQIEGLMVAAPTSSFWFKGKSIDIDEIGAKLNVATVLEGSVRKHGDQLRITAQLVNVEDGYQLWSDRYDKKLDDVFAIQEDIARHIAHRMNADNKEYVGTSLIKTQTENLKAYDLYLKGRFFVNQHVTAQKAIQYFQQALVHDPEYAFAYAGIADAYTTLGVIGSLAPEEYAERARQAAMQALEIDERLPEAHMAMGLLSWHNDWKWQDADNYFTRAIEISPNNAEAHTKYGFFLFWMGRDAEKAFVELKQGVELDPLAYLANNYLGMAYIYSGQTSKAIEQLQKTIELDPASWSALYSLALAYRFDGQYEKAINLHKTAIDQYGRRPWPLSDLAAAYAATGNKALANSIYDELVARSHSEYISPMVIAMICADLDRRDEAFEWLEKAYDERDSIIANIKQIRQLDPLRNDARFIKILNRMGL